MNALVTKATAHMLCYTTQQRTHEKSLSLSGLFSVLITSAIVRSKACVKTIILIERAFNNNQCTYDAALDIFIHCCILSVTSVNNAPSVSQTSVSGRR